MGKPVGLGAPETDDEVVELVSEVVEAGVTDESVAGVVLLALVEETEAEEETPVPLGTEELVAPVPLGTELVTPVPLGTEELVAPVPLGIEELVTPVPLGVLVPDGAVPLGLEETPVPLGE